VPVIDNCTDSNLKLSACRYSGSIKENNMIIAGHSYKSVFGKLYSKLEEDDIIYFKSLAGNVYKYKLTNIESLLPTDVEKMQSGEWSLTLFTCSYDNQKRIAFRFVEVESD
jgi:sortase A